MRMTSISITRDNTCMKYYTTYNNDLCDGNLYIKYKFQPEYTNNKSALSFVSFMFSNNNYKEMFETQDFLKDDSPYFNNNSDTFKELISNINEFEEFNVQRLSLTIKNKPLLLNSSYINFYFKNNINSIFEYFEPYFKIIDLDTNLMNDYSTKFIKYRYFSLKSQSVSLTTGRLLISCDDDTEYANIIIDNNKPIKLPIGSIYNNCNPEYISNDIITIFEGDIIKIEPHEGIVKILALH